MPEKPTEEHLKKQPEQDPHPREEAHELPAPVVVEEHEKPKATPTKEAPRLRTSEPAELPCNVFGTVDRCDGMACEHDGNCYSGCCSLFVSGE